MSEANTTEDPEKFKTAVLNTAKELHQIRDIAAIKKGGRKAAIVIAQQESKVLDKLDRLETPQKNDY